MRGTATMIRMLGAIVGAAGKADMLSTGPWQRLGRELFRIAPGHRMGPRTLVDRFCHEPPGKGVELEPRFVDQLSSAALAERGLACDDDPVAKYKKTKGDAPGRGILVTAV
jgi:hypothetical protein